MRQIHHVVKTSLNAGETSVVENFKLPIGFTTGIAVYTNGIEKVFNLMISIELKDDNSIAIVPALHIDNYRQTTGGDYMKSFKPLNFDTGNRDYTLVITSEDPIPTKTPLKMHIVFLYHNNNVTNDF